MSNKIIQFPNTKQKPVPTVRKVSATVRSLALALKVRLRISSDSSLVYILGDGEAISNLQAIEKWLLNNYNEYEVKAMNSPLNEISNHLVTVLNNKLMMIEDE